MAALPRRVPLWLFSFRSLCHERNGQNNSLRIIFSCKDKWSELRGVHEFLPCFSRVKTGCSDVLRDHVTALVPRWKEFWGCGSNRMRQKWRLTMKYLQVHSVSREGKLFQFSTNRLTSSLMTFLNLLILMTCYILGFGFQSKKRYFFFSVIVKEKVCQVKNWKPFSVFAYNNENKTGRNMDNIKSKNQENVIVIPKRKFTFF